MEPNVSSTTPGADQMARLSKLPRTLMGGTAAMRAAGGAYLPPFTAEPNDAHRARINRSILFNAFAKTVGDMTGRVFTKPIVLADDVPPEIVEFAEDIDNAGRHINVFARDVFYDALQTGVGYILVDMPVAPDTNGRPRTKADAKAAGLRPYLVYLTVEQLIGWKSEIISGVETLTQVRIREFVTEPDGDFHEKEVEQIRVLEPGKWTTYRKRQSGSNIADEWTEYESGVTSLHKITLVPVYLNRTGFMTGAPPLADLADLNVAHWQSSSDQRNILHVARVPILVGSGFEEADQIAVGASSMIRTTNPAATLKYVEHSGAAIGAGREELKDLEFQMQAQGLQLLVPQPGGQTATGEIRDDVKERSQLATMAAALQDALEMAFGYMAEFIGESRGGGSVVINSDFGVSPVGDFTMLLNAVNSDQISRTTFWREAQRRGVLADDFDPDVEAALLDEQAPKLGMDLG